MNLFENVCPKRLQEAFYDVDIRLVGGCVRDFLLDLHPEDVDLAVPIPPPEVIERLKKANIYYLLMGVNFGTVTALIDEKPFEITSLRQDITHIGRHPQVIYTTSFEKDSLRRDFTFNALYIDKNGTLFDPFNGENDLKNGIIRFIGNPYERIAEDPLRILRFYRFFGMVSSSMDPLSHKAVKDSRKDIGLLSKERIWKELSKILMLKKRTDVLTLLKEDLFHDSMHISPNLKDLTVDDIVSPLTLFASLNIDLSLKWSREEAAFLRTLHTLRKSNDDPLLLTLRYPKSLVSQMMYLRFLDGKYTYLELKDVLKSIHLYIVPKFPLKGSDLIQLGIPPGQILGDILKKIREQWEKDPETMGYQACLHMAKDLSSS